MTARPKPLAALAAAALLAAGCGLAADPEPAPPIPDGVARVLTEADAGSTVSIAVGESLAVALVGVPTAGYVWEAGSVPAFLAAGETRSGPTSRAQSEPGFTGGSHWEVLAFTATEPGEGPLALVQHRPWESEEPPAATFEAHIVAISPDPGK